MGVTDETSEIRANDFPVFTRSQTQASPARYTAVPRGTHVWEPSPRRREPAKRRSTPARNTTLHLSHQTTGLRPLLPHLAAWSPASLEAAASTYYRLIQPPPMRCALPDTDLPRSSKAPLAQRQPRLQVPLPQSRPSLRETPQSVDARFRLVQPPADCTNGLNHER